MADTVNPFTAMPTTTTATTTHTITVKLNGKNVQVVTQDAGGSLNLRKAPTTSADILALIPNGTVVAAMDATPETSGWQAVKYNGQNGFVSTQYIKSTTLPVGSYPVSTTGANNTTDTNTQTTTGMFTLTENATKYIKIGVVVIGIGIAGYALYKLTSSKQPALTAETAALNGFSRRKKRRKNSTKSGKAVKKIKLN